MALDADMRACLIATIGATKTAAIQRAAAPTAPQRAAMRTCTPTQRGTPADATSRPGSADVARATGMSAVEARYAVDLFERINAERSALGVRALVWDSRIAATATVWSAAMQSSGYRHDPLFPGSMTARIGTATWVMAENVHYPLYGNQAQCSGVAGPPDSACAHRELMLSATHRRNIVSPLVVRVGIGIHCVAGRGVLITQRFATMRDDYSYGRLLQLKREDAAIPARDTVSAGSSEIRCDP